MKRLLWLTLLSLLLVSCHAPETERGRIVYELQKDFRFAESGSTVLHFQPAEALFHGKRYAALVQDRPGTLSFYVRIPSAARLVYSSLFTGEDPDRLQAQIILESDFPQAARSEFPVRIGQTQKLDLAPFAGLAAKISLSTIAARKSLKGNLFWIHPVIESPMETQIPAGQELAAFRERHRQDNVLIFLFDAGKASHFGCYGYPKPTTPNIDALAAEGIVWKNAFAQASFTRSSTGSLLTGLYPEVHGTGIRLDALPESFKTMAEFFQEGGYKTAFFTGNPNASALPGYGQGFHKVWASGKAVLSHANDFVPVIKSWIDAVENTQFFGYVHFREPHWPYRPPGKFLARFRKASDSAEDSSETIRRTKMMAAYDGNLAFVDEQLGKIVAYLKSKRLMDRTIIVLLSDHGEAFWEHGVQGHQRQVYDEMIRIPLIILFPREPTLKGRQRNDLVGTIDLMPTFLDLFPLSRKGVVCNGESLLPLLEQRRRSDRFLVSQCKLTRAAYALRSTEFKYIHYQSRSISDEFYSLSIDPLEKENVIAKFPVLSSFYRVELQKQLDSFRQMQGHWNVGAQSKVIMDEQTKEQLRALGYVY